MDYFYQIEDKDGARFSWNVWPASKSDAANLVVPLGCMYTPLKRSEAPMVYYEPIMCKGSCKSFLNPYCQVDIDAKRWMCPFCSQLNQFPAHYAGMTQTNLPAELMANVTTIEYSLPQTLLNPATAAVAAPSPAQRLNPVFLFVIDVCVEQEELQKLKDSLMQSLDLLPPNAHVGLISFGTTVQVYDLTFKACTKSFIFRGTHEPEAAKVAATLGIAPATTSGANPGHKTMLKNPYIISLEEGEDVVQTVLEQLHRDPTPVKNDKRPLRSTGVAVSVAISVLEHTYGGQGGRIMVFMGGACTQGPGLMVSHELREPIRSHHDLNKEKAPLVGPSIKYFRGLAQRAASNGHAVDLLSCSLDQTGLLEMKSLCKMTGGLMIMADAFDSEVFQRSFLKIFERDGSVVASSSANGAEATSSAGGSSSGLLQMGFNATIQVVTSPEIKVQGAIGHMFALQQKTSTNVSDKEIGIGGTNIWRVCALDPSSTYAFFFDVVANSQQASQRSGSARPGMVQFLTVYQHANGHRVLRVTTLAHAWAQPGQDHRALIPGFDQEAAAALIARLAVYKSEHEESNPIRWLDRQLITMLNRYAQFRKGDPASLNIPQEMNIFHQFMFYLRRGPLIQVFNNSPDETVFFRYYLQRESTSNVLIMIQPTLESYTLDNDPNPVLLSAASVTKDNVLLLDTFFHIIVHYGSNIASWAQAGYHEQPEYENLKELLDIPKADAAQLITDRMPMPMYVVCNQGTSQARFLTASVDPTITHTSTTPVGQDGQVVLTEDVNLQVFVDFLHRRVVDFEG